MSLPIFIYSAETLQKWNPGTPFSTGIGGSETSHIEMHKGLVARGFNVSSYAPLEVELPDYWPRWYESKKIPLDQPAVLINYRANDLYNFEINPQTINWFIAQDVDYPWTEEQLKKVHRYICLCQTHAQYTLARYPQLAGRVYVSSNGVRSEMIQKIWDNPPERNPNQLIYASSPDRGLKLLLEQWHRIKERVPEAVLKIAYGFENTDTIIEKMNGNAWQGPYKEQLLKLLTQPGVEWLGRIPQDQLYKHWFESNVWAHPTDFPETSCITCMDAQACGAIPITNDLWAIKENVTHPMAKVITGIPQKSPYVRSIWLEEVVRYLQLPWPNEERYLMAAHALKKFDWKNIVTQWENWLKEDIKNV